jgi:hypothetical protein
MEKNKMSTTISVHPLELQGDFASIASIAAVEADCLLRGQTIDLAAVRRVSEELFQFAKRQNTAAVVVLNLALSDSPFHKSSITRVDEVIKEADEIRDRISLLVADPSSFLRDCRSDLENLRAFFVSLSKRAAALDRPFEDSAESEDPFRR